MQVTLGTMTVTHAQCLWRTVRNAQPQINVLSVRMDTLCHLSKMNVCRNMSSV